jgi:A/G-specific adenine glycosylase
MKRSSARRSIGSGKPMRRTSAALRSRHRSLANGDLHALAAAVERWFAAAGRRLPWRRKRHRTGYGALVAEQMLQQTQVSRVIERYGEFMRRFPTVRRLAAAGEQEVLRFWQGLGYYRRARSLHAAAREVVSRCGGRVPRTAARLIQLPGVGRYTAGAIASIVYGERAPIVDGNVRRVICRVLGVAAEPDREWLWTQATLLVEAATDAGSLNEGLMELGATVCAPRAPRCGACPLANRCRARERGAQDSIPQPRRAVARSPVHHHAVIVRRNGAVLMEQRPDRGLWAGLWQPPVVEAAARLDELTVRVGLGVPVHELRLRGAVQFDTTHRRIEFQVFIARAGRVGALNGRRWVPLARLGELPISTAHRRVLDVALRRSG